MSEQGYTVVVDLTFVDFLKIKLEKIFSGSGQKIMIDTRPQLCQIYMVDTETTEISINPGIIRRIILTLQRKPIPKTGYKETQVYTDCAKVVDYTENRKRYPDDFYHVEIDAYSEEWLNILTTIVREYEERMAEDSRHIKCHMAYVRRFKKQDLEADYSHNSESLTDLEIDHTNHHRSNVLR